MLRIFLPFFLFSVASAHAAFAIEQSCQIDYSAGDDQGEISFRPSTKMDCNEEGALRALNERGVQDRADKKVRLNDIKRLTGSRILEEKELDAAMVDCVAKQAAEIEAAHEQLNLLARDTQIQRLSLSLQVSAQTAFQISLGDARATVADSEGLDPITLTTGLDSLAVIVRPRLTASSCETISGARLFEGVVAQAKATLERREQNEILTK